MFIIVVWAYVLLSAPCTCVLHRTFLQTSSSDHFAFDLRECQIAALAGKLSYLKRWLLAKVSSRVFLPIFTAYNPTYRFIYGSKSRQAGRVVLITPFVTARSVFLLSDPWTFLIIEGIGDGVFVELGRSANLLYDLDAVRVVNGKVNSIKIAVHVLIRDMKKAGLDIELSSQIQSQPSAPARERIGGETGIVNDRTNSPIDAVVDVIIIQR